MRIVKAALSGRLIATPPYHAAYHVCLDHAALATCSFGSLESSIFFAFGAGTLSAFFTGLPYCASFSSSASSSARRAATFSNSLSVAFSRRLASSSIPMNPDRSLPLEPPFVFR
jgi:hypothetical protein